MPNLALKTANKLEMVESFIQMTLPVNEAVTAGYALRLDVTAGQFTPSNATTTAENRTYGIALSTRAGAGHTVTALRKGVVDGFDLSALAYDAPIYVSDTDGMLSTTPGTTTVLAGRVIPGWSQPLANTPDKLLFIDL